MKKDHFSDVNRRDFLKGGSMAALMSLMGGIPIHAAEEKPAEAKGEAVTNYKGEAVPVNVGVVGCGLWAREILKTLARLPHGPVVALCDPYPAYLKRAGDLAPKAEKYSDYKEFLKNKALQAVIVATPSHLHREIVLAAMEAGKHVYCEAPLATTVEDAKAIAEAAKKNIKLNFQTGLQTRSDKQITNLNTFVRTGVMGNTVKVRGQFHKKMSWKLTSPNPDREKEINWRLDKSLSLGMAGEIGIHQIDVATWFLGARPLSVTSFGSIAHWKDGREVPDTVQVVIEYPGGIRLNFEGSLANSFDAELMMLYGSDCAIMMRERRAWMFKEVDSPLLGWEVYARKDAFYKESGIALGAGSSKQDAHTAKTAAKSGAEDVVDEKSPLQYSLEAFLYNSNSVGAGVEDFASTFDVNDTAALKKYLADLEKTRLGAAGYKEGYEAAITVIKANEAMLKGEKVQFKPEWFEIA